MRHNPFLKWIVAASAVMLLCIVVLGSVAQKSILALQTPTRSNSPILPCTS